MNLVTLDFETYFDDDYSLKKMTTEAYIRDPRFEVLGVGVRFASDGELRWYRDNDLHMLNGLTDHAVLCHHAQFDGFILSHHYGIKPALWLDTLSMARLVVGNHLSVALDSLAKHYRLAGKTLDYKSFKGKHWHELTAGEQSHIASGCLHDVDLTWRLFEILMRGFPDEELRVIDMTARMFTEPVLEGDVELLGKVWMDEERRKTDALVELGVNQDDLQSSDRFAELLRGEGVEPPLKASVKTPAGIYAFAKTDDFMKELIEDDSRAGALARARLGVRSTLNQTRAERLGFMATRGSLPVYLRYSGAHTTRWSGGDSLNWQNFPRGGDIRRSVKAPAGGALIALDLAQIECRILNVLAGQIDVVEAFRSERDLYSETAARFYGRPISKADKTERHLGKVLELGCLGPDTLVLTDHGTKPITRVLSTDRLWDGIQWVKHRGVVTRGEKTVMRLGDLSLTPDHLVLCGNSWQEASSLRDASALRRALETASASLPSRGTLWERGAAWSPLLFSVLAALRSMPQQFITCGLAGLHVVINALKSNLHTGLNVTTAMPTYALTTGTGHDCSIAYRLASRVADQTDTRIMARGAFRSTYLGKKTNALSWRIFCPWMDGIGPSWKLIVSTLIAAMSPEIFGSQLIRKTHKTSETSGRKLQTYDIACAGPRNRFTVVSSAGPLIVHNCGYGMGAAKLQATCRAGALGGPAIALDESEADAGIRAYRTSHPNVVAYWQTASRMIARLAGGEPLEWGPMLVKGGRIYLPNGAWLNYTTLEYDKDWQAWRIKSRQGWTKLYGGKLVENVVQALARVVLSQAMLRIAALGYKIATCTHDEIVVALNAEERKQDDDAFHMRICQEIMETSPSWLPDLPLKVEGGVSERYEK